MGNKSAQRQFLVKVEGIEGHFATKSGGNITSDTNKVYDGGEAQPSVISSPPEADNLTVSRAYEHARDEQVCRDLRLQVGKFRTTISVKPLDTDLHVIGKGVTYPDALLVGYTEPDVDAAGGDAATWELEFAIGSYV